MIFAFLVDSILRLGQRCALAQRVLQIDGYTVLSQQIGEGFVRQFLKGRHPVSRELFKFVEGVVVERDQLAHAPFASRSHNLFTRFPWVFPAFKSLPFA